MKDARLFGREFVLFVSIFLHRSILRLYLLIPLTTQINCFVLFKVNRALKIYHGWVRTGAQACVYKFPTTTYWGLLILDIRNIGISGLRNEHLSDLIHGLTENGLTHASGPIPLKLPSVTYMSPVSDMKKCTVFSCGTKHWVFRKVQKGLKKYFIKVGRRQ